MRNIYRIPKENPRNISGLSEEITKEYLKNTKGIPQESLEGIPKECLKTNYKMLNKWKYQTNN